MFHEDAFIKLSEPLSDCDNKPNKILYRNRISINGLSDDVDIINEQKHVEDLTIHGRYHQIKKQAWNELINKISTTHDVKLLAYSMFHELSRMDSIGERRIPKTLLMCACVCCAERHMNIPNNESRMAALFGLKLKRLRRAILAVKRQLPLVRGQYKRDKDRIMEICDGLGIGDFTNDIIQWSSTNVHKINNVNNTKIHTSPGTKCAALIYCWLKLHKTSFVVGGKLNFIKICKVSPNGFNSVIQALLCEGV
ncbi:hypothetical protein [Trichoplusia ni ascovirus 2c]|uniref:hypothetical protein n=1 Tax=Trichoplusia ni ascovirus 2c TaxID=328615 RepID=UPI0000E44254|nr:hypothetical protein TNAV2c_gp124 [Trichoplusia ni ascovirus 2c]ABF70641.1 hypothetical protein [Trichoplusia ni ascovirus 2c]